MTSETCRNLFMFGTYNSNNHSSIVESSNNNNIDRVNNNNSTITDSGNNIDSGGNLDRESDAGGPNDGETREPHIEDTKKLLGIQTGNFPGFFL